MNAPPDQLAATVDVPLNMSRTAITLVPGVAGAPCVAYHEIIVCVTSCGWKLLVLSVHSALGFFASPTSARTGRVAPCIWSRASSAEGVPLHAAWMAAQ